MSPESTAAAFSRIADLAKKRAVWLRVEKLIDGTSDHPLTNADVVFDAHQIHYVGSGKLPPSSVLSEGMTAPDTLVACTLMPCLIEAHAHLFLDGSPVNFTEREEYLRQSPEWMLDRGRARWPGILQYGIGTVRD